MRKIHAFLGVFLCFGVFAFAENDAVLNDSTTQENSRIYNAAENAENSGVYRSGVYDKNNDVPFISSQTTNSSALINNANTSTDSTGSKGSLSIGYINTSYTAKQSSKNAIYSDIKGSAHGVDIYGSADYDIIGGFGFSWGLGAEFIYVKWGNPGLIGIESSGTNSAKLDYFKSDWYISPYLNLGLFYEIINNESLKFKIFGKIGAAWDIVTSGRYRGWTVYDYNVFYGKGIYAEQASPALNSYFSFPVNFGARFVFAKHHGVELSAKINIGENKFSNSYLSEKIETTIQRKTSFVLRYVFEF